MSTDGCRPHESVILGLGIGSTLVLKIGAECSNPARSDLCGGPGETSVPTATPLPAAGRVVPEDHPVAHRLNTDRRGIPMATRGWFD